MYQLPIWKLALIPFLATIGSSSADPLDGSPQSADEDPLPGLIEKTNELGGFAATYLLTREEGNLHIRLAYSAPDAVVIEGRSADGVFYSAALEGVIYARWHDSGGGVTGAEVDIQGIQEWLAPVTETISEEFPQGSEDEGDSEGIGEGAWIYFEFKQDDGEPSLKLSVGYAPTREMLCSWLGWLMEARRIPSEDEALLRYETDDGFLVEVSSENGFLQRVWRSDGDPQSSSLVCESLDLEPEHAPDAFDPPEDLEEDSNISESMTAQFRELYSGQLRESFYRGLDRRLEARKLEWDEETRARCLRVFRCYAETAETEPLRAWETSMENHYDQYVESLREWAEGIRDEDDAEGRIREGRDELTAALEENLKEVALDYLAGIELPPDVPNSSGRLEEVLEIEKAVDEALLVEIAFDPLRAHIEEQLDAIIEGSPAMF